MKPGGIGLVQIRFDNGNQKYKPNISLEEYEEKHITATSYALDEFVQFLQDLGFQIILVSKINLDINYATYFFQSGDKS